MGLEEGQDLHILDVSELLKDTLVNVIVRTVARCWGKENIFRPCLQADLVNEHVKNKIQGQRAWDKDLCKLRTLLPQLKLSASHQSYIAQKLHII